jgi:Reverse transcriptase (RNA-dependent DNA polymerase)
VNYRQLNSVIIDDNYDLPFISDIIDEVEGHKIYSKNDLISAYILIRIEPGKEYLSAFYTPTGVYEYVCMPFSMCTSPSHFHRCINTILARYIGNGAQVYFDDIIIYSNTMEEHKNLISGIPSTLVTHNFHGQKGKCKFFAT